MNSEKSVSARLECPDEDANTLTRRYVGQPNRQTHLIEAGVGKTGRPLWCLHATAYSGRSFTPLLHALAKYRHVVAADTPGYGGSDGPRVPWTIADYADSLQDAIEAAGEQCVDLLGYHTGAIVAAEIAVRRPHLVRRLILIGVPYLEGAEQQLWRERLAAPTALGETLAQFQQRWDYFISRRAPGVTLQRGFDNFVDELRAYPNGWRAHEAAFTFDVKSCFSRVGQAVLVLNPHNHLATASRQAASALPNAEIVELPHLKDGIFDSASEELATLMETFLSASLLNDGRQLDAFAG